MGTGVSPLLWPPGNYERAKNRTSNIRRALGPPRVASSRAPTGKFPTEYSINDSFPTQKKKYGQASRLISTSQLKPSQALHIWPITWWSSRSLQGPEGPGRSHLGEGFTLRCFQHFSLPNVATQHCRWRDNWYTRGSSIPVLSY